MTVGSVGRDRRALMRFLVVVVGTAVIGLVGYVGFVSFVESDRAVATGFVMLSAATGFAAMFSPCSFPLLLTFLARRAVDSPRRAAAGAARVGAGAALFLGALGGAVALGATALGDTIGFDTTAGRILRLAVGCLLVVLGLRQARIVVVRLPVLDRVASAAGSSLDPARGDVVYGFGYLLAGFG